MQRQKSKRKYRDEGALRTVKWGGQISTFDSVFLNLNLRV